MAVLRVRTWNICGDSEGRAEDAAEVMQSKGVDIAVFQKARKTKPRKSNLRDATKGMKEYKFAFCPEYSPSAEKYGGTNYYPDTTGKCYYLFYDKDVLQAQTELSLIDYKEYLDSGGKDPDSNLLKTRRPSSIEFKHKATGAAVLLVTWHAPLAPVGGAIFNGQAHQFLDSVLLTEFNNKIGIAVGDFNATGGQMARTYDDAFETSGHHYTRVLTNAKINKSNMYKDYKSDVHYLCIFDIGWP